METIMSEMKRVIGVTGPSGFSPKIQKMVEKHFKAIPLYINQNGPEDLSFVLNHVDAIILAGGVDICPISFDNEITNGDDLSSFDLDRDRREIFIVDWAKRFNVPILGICRGHQMLGLLHELPFSVNINDSKVCHNPISRKIDVGDSPVHFVHNYEKYTTEFFRREPVNSFHHQAILFKDDFNYEKRGVEVIGTALLDYEIPEGIIELMRGINQPFLSCQWHPENDYETNTASKKVLAAFEKMIHNKTVSA